MIRLVAALTLLATPAAAQQEHHHVQLDTLKVRAERTSMQLRSGVTVVDARAAAAASGTIADLLRTVPGIEIDADGRISMRGSTSVLVLMNGRRSAMTGDALVAFLRQMPATALERIEAGTIGSAQHSADGAGVVNLVFRNDDRPRTATRSVAASIASDDHYMGSAAASGDVSNILEWDATYAVSGMRPRTESNTARWSIVPGDLPLQTEQHNRAREKHRLHSVMAGAAVTPTSRTSLALRGTYSWMEGAYRNNSAFVYTNTAGNTGTSATGSVTEHAIPSGELSAAATVNLGAVRFSSEARGSFVDEDFRGDYRDEVAGFTYLTNVMRARQRERGLRNDVNLRLSGIQLDAGHESQFQTITVAHDARHFDATLVQNYHYQLDVHAGYLSARRSIGGVNAEAGLRVEAERTRTEIASSSTERAVRLFPTLSGEWTDARRALVYRVAYGRRIHRPDAEMLNPFSMGMDDMNETFGNPFLLPEISDQLQFGVERHRPQLTLQLTPFVRWTNNPIRQIKSATARGSATTTLENLTAARAIGADGSVRARPTANTVVTLTGSVAHSKTTADDLSSSGVHATGRLTVDVRVMENTTAQFYAYRRSAKTIEQGEILPAFTSEVALMHRLANDRARLTLRLIDPWRSDRLAFRIAGAAFTEESRLRTARPLLSLFASYAVGGAPREDAPVHADKPARIF